MNGIILAEYRKGTIFKIGELTVWNELRVGNKCVLLGGGHFGFCDNVELAEKMTSFCFCESRIS